MLVFSKGGLSAAQAASYYQEKYAHDDYYSEDQRVIGEWVGHGATTLGLVGGVERRQFEAVLNGLHPQTNAVLIDSNATGERRAGWDGTFNAPKSVSLQALIGGDERILTAHRPAVDRTLQEIERYVQTRQHGGSERVTTENMVAAKFEHLAARPSRAAQGQGYGPDPHLHTHVVVINMTQRHDGAWRAVEPLELYRSQELGTAIYRTELAQAVQQLGYQITLTGQRGEWELAGYERSHIEAFSHRRQDIAAHLQERDLHGAGAAQIAAHQTRLGKDHRDEHALRMEWRDRAATLGLEVPRTTAMAREHGAYTITPGERQRVTEAAVTYASAHTTERNAVVDRRAMEATALQRGMGTTDVEQVRTEMIQRTRQGELIDVQHQRFPQGGFTTKEMLALEQDNIQLMQAGKGHTQPMASRADVQAWAQERTLYAEQTRVAEHVLTSRDWLTAIEGKAGATKTTTIGALREFMEQQGYTVRGFGPTTGSVRALHDAGVQAETVAHLNASTIRAGHSAQEVWIVDESSLLATRQTNTLLHQARVAGTAHVLFVGDQRQHAAVEAGRPIAQLQAAGMATARLDTIRRQRDPELRKAVELASRGQTANAVTLLNQQERVAEIPDRDARYQAIAHEYVRSVEAKQRVLVVSPANEERTALNTEIRAQLHARGYVPSEGYTHTVLVNRNITGAERGWAGSYEVGDVVHYHRGSEKLGIAAGSYTTVQQVDRTQNRLTVRADDGTEQTYAPARLKSVEVFRAESRAFVEGERIQFRAPQKEQQIANGAFGRIAHLDRESGNVTIQLDSGASFSARLQSLRHIEYGYATTSHSSQGATVDRVLVNVDTERSAELVNQQQFYVSISRARYDVQVFTNDGEKLSQVVSRIQQKATAVDAVRETTQAKQERHTGGTPRSAMTKDHTAHPHQSWRHEEIGNRHGTAPQRARSEWRHERLPQNTQQTTRPREHDQRQATERGLGHGYRK